MTRWPLSILGALLIGACTSSQEVRNTPRPEQSFAGTLMRAASMTPSADAPSLESAWDPAFLRGAIDGRTARGAGNLLLGNPVSALASFAAPTDQSARFPTLVAYLPASIGATPDEARLATWEIVRAALLDVADKGLIQPKPDVSTLTWDASYFSGPEEVREVELKCYHDNYSTFRIKYCQIRISTFEHGLPGQGVAPDITGGGQVWRFDTDTFRWAFSPAGYDRSLYYAIVDEITLYRELSARLPAWAFLWVPPQRVGYFDRDLGTMMLFPAPVLFNQGEAHFFYKGATREDGLLIDGWDSTQSRIRLLDTGAAP